jgi:hypothetical protein
VIYNDGDLQATRERVADFQTLLAQLRVTCDPDEFPLVASGYQAELEKMQREVIDYLTQPAGRDQSVGKSNNDPWMKR